jgi:hypothetical protein
LRYPNLRYGNPNELNYYAQGIPVKELARRLRRSERSVRNWLTGAQRVPWWIPELLRLQHWEHIEKMRQMNVPVPRARLGVVKSATVYEFPSAQRLDDQRQLEIDRPCEDRHADAESNEAAFY